MPDIPQELRTELAKLTPEARTRVEAALKGTLDKELAGGAGPGGRAAAFSRGIFFSKSGRSISLDDEVLPGLAQLDDAKFNTFVERVTALRGGKGPGG